LLGIGVYILAFVAAFTLAAIVDVWQSPKPQDTKLLWTLVLVLVPGIGLALYAATLIQDRRRGN
jgi:hypothetical protein